MIIRGCMNTNPVETNCIFFCFQPTREPIQADSQGFWYSFNAEIDSPKNDQVLTLDLNVNQYL